MGEPAVLSRVTVVLWRPKSPGNVGAVARAMRNMGFARLRIAAPMRYDDPGFFATESRRMAWRAEGVLAERREYPTIEAALADAVLVAGTTSAPPRGRVALPPRDLAPALLDAARTGNVALLFGQEDIGLTRDALARCRLLGAIPASDVQASLNLAQAVLIFLYEIRLAALARDAGAPLPAAAPDPAQRLRLETDPPRQAEVEGFHRRLASALDAARFFEGTAGPHMRRELRALLAPALATRRGMRILEGVVRRLGRGQPRASRAASPRPDRPPPPRPRR